ncbi:hypothetical protein ACFU7D_03005 [Nocardioides sp. NPDC057577]|uniref:hypothetical protein n=1 Tax=Nocardioides sp. NPDC057577 TaxID=3346171 RepID=UPI0036716828
MSIEQLQETLREHAAAIEDDTVLGRGPAVRRRAATIRLRRALVVAAVAVIVVPVAVMASLGANPFDRTAPVVRPVPSNGPFVGTYAGRTLIDSEIATGRSELSFTAEASRNTEWRAVCRGVGSGYTLHLSLDDGEPGQLPCDVELLSGRWISYQLGPEYPQEGTHTLRLWLTSTSGRAKAPPADGQIGAAVYRLPEPAATVAGHQVQALEMDGGSEFRLVRREESMPGTRVLSSTYSSRALPVEVDWYTSGSGSQEVQVYVDGRPETGLILGDGGPGLVLTPEEAHTVSLRIVGDVPADALLGIVWREEAR